MLFYIHFLSFCIDNLFYLPPKSIECPMRDVDAGAGAGATIRPRQTDTQPVLISSGWETVDIKEELLVKLDIMIMFIIIII